MKYVVTIGGETRELTLSPSAVEVDGSQRQTVEVDGRQVEADVLAVPGTGVVSVFLDKRSRRITAQRLGRGRWRVLSSGREHDVEVLDPPAWQARQAAIERGGSEALGAVSAPMPGMVIRVEVTEGDDVEEGQGLVIVEAMKMENELKAPADGTVVRVAVEPGEAVEKGQLLLELGPSGGQERAAG